LRLPEEPDPDPDPDPFSDPTPACEALTLRIRGWAKRFTRILAVFAMNSFVNNGLKGQNAKMVRGI